MPKLQRQVISVFELLRNGRLVIPPYQRPYKWTTRHVQQLLSDIANHGHKAAYRLGTIVFHDDGAGLNIVDGQQRTITLLLVVRALLADPARMAGSSGADLQVLARSMVNPAFASDRSKANLRANYPEIRRILLRDFDDPLLHFMLRRCEVVTFTLGNISEAFQFFDSQNARGKDLDPHDLLKAYHLREFDPADAPHKADTVGSWEAADDDELAAFFAQFWASIRNWARGVSGLRFEKENASLFKGVSLHDPLSYPHAEAPRMTHAQAEDQGVAFPCQLDQVIVNGRRFFEMTSHYRQLVAGLPGRSGADPGGDYASRILQAINTYPARKRTGDRSARALFDCVVARYIDKFGHAHLDRVIEKAFVWAYSLRLGRQRVEAEGMDKYVLSNNPFALLRDAVRPEEFLRLHVAVPTTVRSTRTEALEALFHERSYLA